MAVNGRGDVRAAAGDRPARRPGRPAASRATSRARRPTATTPWRWRAGSRRPARPGSTSSTSTARGPGSRAAASSPSEIVARDVGPCRGRGRRRPADAGGTSPARSGPGPPGSPSARRRCATRRSRRASSPATARTGSSARSTSATAWRSARAGGRAPPGVPADEAIAHAGRRRRRRPSRSRRSSATACWAARTSPCCARSSRSSSGRIIASGGVASIEDVIAVQAAGCAGAIVGRALYEGRIDLRELTSRAVAARRQLSRSAGRGDRTALRRRRSCAAVSARRGRPSCARSMIFSARCDGTSS